ncbi:MAG TPA: alpha-L-fucosidase, partial [Armatimonadota bacterium]
FDEGDYGTPERDWDDTVLTVGAFARPIEACQSVGAESWGYRADEDYYTPAHLIGSIDRYLAKGANYLLNVGPQPDGRIGEESAARLRACGAWYRHVREALADAEPLPACIDHAGVLATRRDNTLYLHLNPSPITTGFSLKPLRTLPRRATILNTGAPADLTLDVLPSQWGENVPYLHLRHLPVARAAEETLVVKLEYDDWPLC